MNIRLNGVQNTTIQPLSLTRSWIAPAELRFALPQRHDAASLRPNATVELTDDDDTTRFYGWLIDTEEGGVLEEGVTYVARGRRHILENEPVQINGSAFFVWNRRGSHCDNQGVHDSPNNDGSKWTVGQIIIDILEHALGLPGGGSDISNHHGDSDDITTTYLTSAVIASYTSADILAIDTVIGEFSVSNTPVAQAIQMLLEAAGGFYGWYIAPDGELVVADLTSLSSVDIEAGEDDHWVDEDGTDYRLLSNQTTRSINGVYSRVKIQGYDQTVEVKPADIDGLGNAAKSGGGRLEYVGLINSMYVYRAEDQPYRLWTSRGVDPTPPPNWFSWVDGPRLYRGQVGGAKTVVNPSKWWLNAVTGLIYIFEDLDLDPGEYLWGWYWARTPYTSSAGPDGNAYERYGLDRTLTVVDTAFRSTTAYPPGGDDDSAAMAVLAERMLDKVKDVRIQGKLKVDGIEWATDDLENRFDVLHLDQATESYTGSEADPYDWTNLAINCVEIVSDFVDNSTTITIANTFYMLEGYSELKRRLKENLFSQRELVLSEDIADCSVMQSQWSGGGVTETESESGTETETSTDTGTGTGTEAETEPETGGETEATPLTATIKWTEVKDLTLDGVTCVLTVDYNDHTVVIEDGLIMSWEIT